MKRSPSTLFVKMPTATIPIPWDGIDNVIPNIRKIYKSPTKEIVEAAWQAFVASGDELEIIADPAPAPPLIRSIDMRRLCLALEQMELLDDIESAIAAQPRSAQIEWQRATDVKADHPLVVQLATAMSLDIDEIFDLAESFT